MTTTKQFSKISSYQGDNFKKYFEDMPFKKGKVLTDFRKLEMSMNDKAIIEKWNPEPVSLGDVYATLEKLDCSVWAIFYCKDEKGTLRAVNAFWYGVGWNLIARSVGGPGVWDAGDQVFSRGFSDSKTLGHSVACPHCKKIIKLS